MGAAGGGRNSLPLKLSLKRVDEVEEVDLGEGVLGA